MLALRGCVAVDVANYRFENVMQLGLDFRAGRFTSALTVGKHGRRERDNLQRRRG